MYIFSPCFGIPINMNALLEGKGGPFSHESPYVQYLMFKEPPKLCPRRLNIVLLDKSFVSYLSALPVKMVRHAESG